jgi:hypothetical protein
MSDEQWMRGAATAWCSLFFGNGARAQSESDRIRELERQVQALRDELRAQSGSGTNVKELERRIDILAEEIEKLKSGETGTTPTKGCTAWVPRPRRCTARTAGSRSAGTAR